MQSLYIIKKIALSLYLSLSLSLSLSSVIKRGFAFVAAAAARVLQSCSAPGGLSRAPLTTDAVHSAARSVVFRKLSFSLFCVPSRSSLWGEPAFRFC